MFLYVIEREFQISFALLRLSFVKAFTASRLRVFREELYREMFGWPEQNWQTCPKLSILSASESPPARETLCVAQEICVVSKAQRSPAVRAWKSHLRRRAKIALPAGRWSCRLREKLRSKSPQKPTIGITPGRGCRLHACHLQ
jgi:hypothetical protein